MYTLLPSKEPEIPAQKKIEDLVSDLVFDDEWGEIGLMDVVLVDGILTQENDNKESRQQEG